MYDLDRPASRRQDIGTLVPVQSRSLTSASSFWKYVAVPGDSSRMVPGRKLHRVSQLWRVSKRV